MAVVVDRDGEWIVVKLGPRPRHYVVARVTTDRCLIIGRFTKFIEAVHMMVKAKTEATDYNRLTSSTRRVNRNGGLL